MKNKGFVISFVVIILVIASFAFSAFADSSTPDTTGDAQINDNEFLLAWNAQAQQPGEHYADMTGELVFIKNDGPKQQY